MMVMMKVKGSQFLVLSLLLWPGLHKLNRCKIHCDGDRDLLKMFKLDHEVIVMEYLFKVILDGINDYDH